MRCEGPTLEFLGEEASDRQPPSRATRAPARQGAAHFAVAQSAGKDIVKDMLGEGTRGKPSACSYGLLFLMGVALDYRRDG